jgi:hypothetical protein
MNPTIIIGIVVVVICISISISAGVYLSQKDDKTSADTTSADKTSASKVEPAPTTPTYVPFNAGSQTGTGANDWGGGNSIYLDRHNVNCGNKGLNQLQFVRPAGDKIEWKYTCADGGKLGSNVSKSTPGSDWGGGNTIYLDRHDANCGENNVMTQLQLVRPTGDQIQWKYTCAPNTQSKALSCRDLKTPANEDGGGNSIYFDRHDIKCNADEAISRLHLTRPSGNQIQWEYKCCK